VSNSSSLVPILTDHTPALAAASGARASYHFYVVCRLPRSMRRCAARDVRWVCPCTDVSHDVRGWRRQVLMSRLLAKASLCKRHNAEHQSGTSSHMSFIISMEALVKLMESARQWVLKNLPYDRNDPKVYAVLQAKSPRDLLVLYLNWRERLIPTAPRQVLRSPAFDTNPIVRAIAQIVHDIEQGRMALSIAVNKSRPTSRCSSPFSGSKQPT
jgi:hypothetical protein